MLPRAQARSRAVPTPDTQTMSPTQQHWHGSGSDSNTPTQQQQQQQQEHGAPYQLPFNYEQHVHGAPHHGLQGGANEELLLLGDEVLSSFDTFTDSTPRLQGTEGSYYALPPV